MTEGVVYGFQVVDIKLYYSYGFVIYLYYFKVIKLLAEGGGNADSGKTVGKSDFPIASASLLSSRAFVKLRILMISTEIMKNRQVNANIMGIESPLPTISCAAKPKRKIRYITIMLISELLFSFFLAKSKISTAKVKRNWS